MNLEFRNELRELLEDDADDAEIVKFVLDHAWHEWPHAFELWLNEKRRYVGFD